MPRSASVPSTILLGVGEVEAQVEVVEPAGNETFVHVGGGRDCGWSPACRRRRPPARRLADPRLARSRAALLRSGDRRARCDPGRREARPRAHAGALPARAGRARAGAGGVTFWLALYEYDLIRPPEWIGFGNFRELAERRRLPRPRCGTRSCSSSSPSRCACSGRSRSRCSCTALPRRRRLPDGRVPADGRSRRRLRAALALDPQPALRAAQPDRSGALGVTPPPLADRPAGRAVGGDPDEPVHDRRGLPRRARHPPEPPARAVRAGLARGRRRRWYVFAASRCR